MQPMLGEVMRPVSACLCHVSLFLPVPDNHHDAGSWEQGKSQLLCVTAHSRRLLLATSSMGGKA